MASAQSKDSTDSIVDLWIKSSIQTYHLCRANGVGYIHFLQPTPFFGDRSLTIKEQKVIRVGNGNGKSIKRFYPLFLEASSMLVDQGGTFVNATDFMDDCQKTVYADTFGHFNQRGNDIFALKMSVFIIDEISGKEFSKG